MIPTLVFFLELQDFLDPCNFADIGCGFGVSSLMIANAFQNSKIYGFDIHRPSIENANKEAKQMKINNAIFKVADAENYDGEFDIITFLISNLFESLVNLF